MNTEPEVVPIKCPHCGRPAVQRTLIVLGMEKTLVFCNKCAPQVEVKSDFPMMPREAGLPERLIDETMDDFKVDEKNRNVYEWYKTFISALNDKIKSGQSVFLTGRYGTGKTKIATDIFKRCLELGYRGRVLNNGEIRFNLNKYAMDGYEKSAWISKYRAVRLLFWDDIGQGKLTDSQIDFYYQVINYRYDNRLPTLFTSHTNSEELSGIIGEENLSRILGMCQGNVIKIEGDDRRIK